MKALAILVACLVLAAPAQGFGRAGGPGPGGFHPGGKPPGGLHPGGGAHPGRPGHHRPYDGLGLWFGGGGGYLPTPVEALAPPEPEIIYSPVPYCPTPSRPKPGPRIIYIGAKPAIHGPKVIYGGQ